MAKREWGVKHLCAGCGARYYDLNRSPITCPRCGEAYVPEVATKSRRPAAAKQKAKPKIVAVEMTEASAAALKVVSDGEDVADDDTDDDAVVDVEVAVDDEDDDDGGDVIEDVSELGEDEDDMAEVLEGSREVKED